MKTVHQKDPAARWMPVILAAFLVLGVAGLFAPVLQYDFTNYDEVSQVLENQVIRSLRPDNLARIFSTFCITSYYPVRLLTFAVDYHFWQLNPKGFHLTNLALHALNVGLLFWLLRRWANGGGKPARFGAFAAALLFGVHPVAVEPVAWVSGREELLTVFFTLCALHACTGWKPASGRQGPWAMAAAWVATACACMSNAVGAAVPAMLTAFLTIFRPQPTPDNRPATLRDTAASLLRRTWPLWLLAAATLIVKRIGDSYAPHGAPSMNQMPELTLFQRVYSVPLVFALNLLTLFCPWKLNLLYPSYAEFDPKILVLAPAGLLLAGLTGYCLWRTARLAFGTGRPGQAAVSTETRTQYRLILFGLVWFLAALAPSAHVIQHHIIRADRFLYPALPGLALALSCAVLQVADRRKWLIPALAGLLGVGAVLAVGSRLQLPVWRNGFTLFSHVIDLNPRSAEAHANLGICLRKAGRIDEALDHYRKALEIDPKNVEARIGIAVALVHKGEYAAAIPQFQEALRLSPRDAKALNGLGAAHLRIGNTQAALRTLEEAVRIDDALPDAHNNLGLLLMNQNRFDEALKHHVRAVQLNPFSPEIRTSLGVTLFNLKRYTDAEREYREAARINPAYMLAHYNLGTLLSRQGRLDEALAEFRMALQLAPTDAETIQRIRETHEALRRPGPQRQEERKP